jgi:hypothetical protein
MEKIEDIINAAPDFPFEADTLNLVDLPKVISWFAQKIMDIEERVINNAPRLLSDSKKQWMDAKALSVYLPNHPSVQTIYGWTSTRSIPFHKRGKYTIFDKQEIDEWLSGDYYETDAQLDFKAQRFVNTHKKRKG